VATSAGTRDNSFYGLAIGHERHVVDPDVGDPLDGVGHASQEGGDFVVPGGGFAIDRNLRGRRRRSLAARISSGLVDDGLPACLPPLANTIGVVKTPSDPI
jgi:hypothetical protein